MVLSPFFFHRGVGDENRPWIESGTYKLFLFVTPIPEISNAIVIKEHVY